MFPPIFQVCAADLGVTAVLGSDPVRLFPFGQAPQGVEYPYAVWQRVGGSPENYLGDRPDIDQLSIQIDVYGASMASVQDAVIALRDAIEPSAYVTRWGFDSRDPNTGNYRMSFDVDWFVPR